MTLILGLESSCDDTAAAVVSGATGRADIHSNIVADQNTLHAAFGGVVPEIAARAHVEKIDLCVEQALAQANTTLDRLDAIAVTAGPGLIGGVLAGVMCAKGLAAAADLPIVAVNHLAGHALTPRLTDALPYPYLMLLVSGGHCQFLIVRSPTQFRRLGGTIDDAPGEAFDKVAKLLGLPQPGGPAVERTARDGDPARFDLPRPLLHRDNCDMSFSGLKTAVLRARDTLIAANDGLRQSDRADLCAGFQAAVSQILARKTRKALETAHQMTGQLMPVAIAGGVSANTQIRTEIEHICAEFNVDLIAPPLPLCTDNAAMIAYAGLELFESGHRDGFDFAARPRWPLDTDSPAMLGSGKKGPRA